MAINKVEGSFAIPLKKGEKLLPRYLHRYVDEISEIMVEEIKRRTPIDTGRLKDSIKPYRSKRVGYTALGGGIYQGGAYTNLIHGRFMEHGTKPHKMKMAKNRNGNFVFVSNGRKVFAKEIDHPGTKPVKMFARGADATERRIRPPFERIFIEWKAASGL